MEALGEPQLKHWTQRDDAALTFAVSADFGLQIEKRLERGDVSLTGMAKSLGLTPSAVSQVINGGPNLTIKTIVRYAKSLGMKVAIVAYEDGDPENNHGPICSELFGRCWDAMGKPRDFFDLAEKTGEKPLDGESSQTRIDI